MKVIIFENFLLGFDFNDTYWISISKEIR